MEPQTGPWLFPLNSQLQTQIKVRLERKEGGRSVCLLLTAGSNSSSHIHSRAGEADKFTFDGMISRLGFEALGRAPYVKEEICTSYPKC